MKMKNQEEKNRLLVELCYNYHFHMGDSSILDHHHCERIFQKYSFNQKISNKVYCWLTLWSSKKLQKNNTKTVFWQSINDKLCLISFDWLIIFEIFFHSDDDLRLKNHPCENGNYSTILQEVDFLLLHFSFSFFNFFPIFFVW